MSLHKENTKALFHFINTTKEQLLAYTISFETHDVELRYSIFKNDIRLLFPCDYILIMENGRYIRFQAFEILEDRISFTPWFNDEVITKILAYVHR